MSKDEEEEEYARKISISLPSSLVERIEEYADEKKLKRSQVISKAVNQFLEELEEPDLWEEKVDEKLDRILSVLELEKEEEVPLKEQIKLDRVRQILEDCRDWPLAVINEEKFAEIVKEEGLIGNGVWSNDALRLIAEYIYKNVGTEPEELMKRIVEYIEVDPSRLWYAKAEELKEEEE